MRERGLRETGGGIHATFTLYFMSVLNLQSLSWEIKLDWQQVNFSHCGEVLNFRDGPTKKGKGGKHES